MKSREYPPRECSVCGLFNYHSLDNNDCRQCGSPLLKIDYEWLKRNLIKSVRNLIEQEVIL